MAVTEQAYTGNGSTTNYSFTFPYLKSTDIQVQLNASVTTNWSLANATTIQFTAPSGGATTTQETGGAPKSGVAIKILRDTNVDNLTATFYAGSSIKSEDLNDNFTQNLYVTQEIGNRSFENTGTSTMIGNLNMGEDTTIVFEGATDNDHETTLTVADPTADRTITLPNVTGTVVTTGDTGSITVGMMGSNSVDSDELVNGSIDTDHIADDQVTYAKIQNVSATDRILGRDSSGAGIIEEIAPAALRTMINVEDGATADQTGAEIKTAYEAQSDTNAFTDTLKTRLDSVENNADVTDATNVNAAGAVMNTDSTTADMQFVVDEDDMASDSATKVPTQQSTKAYIGTYAQPKDADLTTLAGMQSATASILASGTALTSTTAELNLLDGKSIVTTISGSSTDAQLPTAQAVDERIVSLVTDVGGFVPIANETSFPTTNPDPADNAGTIVSIKALASNLTSNGSGVATITNGAGSGNNVTITGMANSDTIEAGKGILVETTTTSGDGSANPPRAYTFHRETLAPADVTAAKTAVDDFADRYQIAASAPSAHPDSSALQEGDLWFDTGANIMKVYDGSNYAAVTSVGDYKLLTVVPDGATSGTPDYTNLSFDLRDGGSAASITSVGQLLVSVNGVIQKPNSTSWSASNEGFHLEGSNGIKFCTAPGSGASVFVTLIGSATSVNVPATNSIVEAAIQTNVVSEEKLKVSNSPTNGHFLSAQSGNSGGLTWAAVDLSAKMDKTGDTFTGDTTFYGGVINKIVIWDASDFALEFWDDVKATFGSDADLQIVHDATDNQIKSTNGKIVISTTAGNSDIEITPNGTGDVVIDGLKYPQADGTASQALTTNGSGQLSWSTVESTKAGGAIYENSQTISETHTLTANTNGMSAGPITVNSGITLTIPSGATYTIV